MTFIDGFSRYTWLYLLNHKSNVFTVFKDLYALIKNKFGNTIKVLRSDNGTEYVNQEFEHFLFLMVLNIKQPVLTLQSKTVLLKEKIGIYLRLLILLCS